uniref:tRNA selenocysteine-associated protein 1 n=1 Tax=Romanomermis culicivorax TaxID=13658 RepID=A0A915JXD4_ROMCU
MNRGNNVLWMGDLDHYMDGDFIGEAFRLMGEHVLCVKLVMDKYDGHKAGYCFVDMVDEQSARRAMLQINGRIVPNTKPPVKFNLSFANNPAAGATEYNLFVNNLPSEIGDAELYQIFGH